MQAKFHALLSEGQLLSVFLWNVSLLKFSICCLFVCCLRMWNQKALNMYPPCFSPQRVLISWVHKYRNNAVLCIVLWQYGAHFVALFSYTQCLLLLLAVNALVLFWCVNMCQAFLCCGVLACLLYALRYALHFSYPAYLHVLSCLYIPPGLFVLCRVHLTKICCGQFVQVGA